MQNNDPEQQTRAINPATKLIATAALVVIVGAGAFVGGMQYQKGHSTGSTASASAAGGLGQSGTMRRPGSRNGGFGSITAVSDTSITIKSQREGTSKTYTINSATVITDNGTTSTASSLAVGGTVMVQTANSTSTVATKINANPTMGGAPPSADNSSDTSTGTSTTDPSSASSDTLTN